MLLARVQIPKHLKCLWREIFLRKYLAHHMYKPIPMEEKFQKT